MPDRAQQRAFIADMTQQMLGELQNEALACALGSVHQFAAAFGLFQPEAGARGAPTVEFRIKVLVCAHSRLPQFQSRRSVLFSSLSTAPPHLFLILPTTRPKQFRSTVLNFAGILKGIQATDEERRDSALSTSAAAVSAELADADNDDGGGGDAVDFASSVSAAAAALLAVPQRDVSGAASTGVMLQAGWPLLQAILPQILQVRQTFIALPSSSLSSILTITHTDLLMNFVLSPPPASVAPFSW